MNPKELSHDHALTRSNSPLEVLQQEFGETIDSLSESITALENRLDMLLNQETSPETQASKTPNTYTASLLTSLETLRLNICYQKDRIDQILSRLQI